MEEACFWKDNAPSLWMDVAVAHSTVGNSADASDDVVRKAKGGYSAIYTPGTRIVSPPLVVAFLGETLVCPSIHINATLLWVIQQLLLLAADGIGALCIYHIGKRICEMEEKSEEGEIERQTTSLKNTLGERSTDLMVPEILRPERGWVFGLAYKVLLSDESLGILEKRPEKQKTDKAANSNGNSSYVTNDHYQQILTLQLVPLVASIVYFSNPISMIANATGSLRSLWDALLLLSLYYATLPPTTLTKEGAPIKRPSASKSALSLALATYVDLAYAVFLLPILLWRGSLSEKPSQVNQHHDWKTVLVLFLSYLGGLHLLASALVGGDWNEYKQVMLQTVLPNVSFVEQDSSGSVPGPCMGLHW